MTPDPNAPACACCWPTFTPAVVRDDKGWPRCIQCAATQRKVNMPYFLRNYVEWEPQAVGVKEEAA